jgi:hypothetical protein
MNNMDDIFAQILDIADNAIYEPTSEELVVSCINDDPMIPMIEQVKNITYNATTHVKKPTNVEVDDFDKTMNLLDVSVNARFKSEKIGDETRHLTQPRITTATVVGMFANVNMMEAVWVKELPVCKEVLMLRCNFGEKIYKNWVPPERKPKKKKDTKKESTRKKQGTGLEFNTQLTFVMNSDPDIYFDDDIIPTDILTFKVKVFRNGKIQLPGTDATHVDAILRAIRKIESVCNAQYCTGEIDMLKWIMIYNVNLFMKNYKFQIKKAKNQLINLARLSSVFRSEKIAEQSNTTIAIYEVNYDRSSTNCSVLFSTPVYNKPDKRLRMTIEKSGKVNIKGGLYVEHSTQAFNILDYILRTTSNIIVDEHSTNHKKSNVKQTMTDDEIILMWSKNTIL